MHALRSAWCLVNAAPTNRLLDRATCWAVLMLGGQGQERLIHGQCVQDAGEQLRKRLTE